MDPLVSIVVPCYKGERYLAEAIESCLNQSHHHLEVIVVDDASPDRCAEIAETYARADFRVKVVRCAVNGGVSRAFNAGFRVAKGRYLTRLAQDDLFDQTAIEALVRFLEEHPDIGLAYADLRNVTEELQYIDDMIAPEPSDVLRYGNRVGLCVMWRDEVWRTVGEFDPAFDTVDDYEYWTRVAARFKLGKCGGGPLMSFRVHSEMGSKVFSIKQEILAAELLARHVPSRREAAVVLERGYYNAAYNSMLEGKSKDSLRYLWRATFCWPLDIRLYKLYGKLLFLAVRGRKI